MYAFFDLLLRVSGKGVRTFPGLKRFVDTGSFPSSSQEHTEAADLFGQRTCMGFINIIDVCAEDA